jgi:hypothetical protein
MNALRRTAVLAAVFGASVCLVPSAFADFAVLRSTMSGANEVGGGDPDGTGSALVTINSTTGRICYSYHVSGIAPPVAAAHIHRGSAGMNGPVVIPFKAAKRSFASECKTVDRVLAQEIIDNPSGFYTNVHNAQFPGGAIRGQLHAVTTVRTPPSPSVLRP